MALWRETDRRGEEEEEMVVVAVELTEAAGELVNLAQQGMALVPYWEVYSHHVTPRQRTMDRTTSL